MSKKVIIAEDHPLFRIALKMALKEIDDSCITSDADSIDVLQRILEKEKNPNLVLLDLNMPGAQGFSALHFMKGYYPKCPIAVISAHEEIEVMVKAKQFGAMAYIPKSSDSVTLMRALSDVLNGKTWFTEAVKNSSSRHEKNKVENGISTLTPQQFRILGMIGEGMLNKQIAYELNISEPTVKAHVTAIFKKLGVTNRTQAVISLKEMELKSFPNSGISSESGMTGS